MSEYFNRLEKAAEIAQIAPEQQLQRTMNELSMYSSREHILESFEKLKQNLYQEIIDLEVNKQSVAEAADKITVRLEMLKKISTYIEPILTEIRAETSFSQQQAHAYLTKLATFDGGPLSKDLMSAHLFIDRVKAFPEFKALETTNETLHIEKQQLLEAAAARKQLSYELMQAKLQGKQTINLSKNCLLESSHPFYEIWIKETSNINVIKAEQILFEKISPSIQKTIISYEAKLISFLKQIEHTTAATYRKVVTDHLKFGQLYLENESFYFEHQNRKPFVIQDSTLRDMAKQNATKSPLLEMNKQIQELCAIIDECTLKEPFAPEARFIDYCNANKKWWSELQRNYTKYYGAFEENQKLYFFRETYEAIRQGPKALFTYLKQNSYVDTPKNQALLLIEQKALVAIDKIAATYRLTTPDSFTITSQQVFAKIAKNSYKGKIVSGEIEKIKADILAENKKTNFLFDQKIIEKYTYEMGFLKSTVNPWQVEGVVNTYLLSGQTFDEHFADIEQTRKTLIENVNKPNYNPLPDLLKLQAYCYLREQLKYHEQAKAVLDQEFAALKKEVIDAPDQQINESTIQEKIGIIFKKLEYLREIQNISKQLFANYGLTPESFAEAYLKTLYKEGPSSSASQIYEVYIKTGSIEQIMNHLGRIKALKLGSDLGQIVKLTEHITKSLETLVIQQEFIPETLKTYEGKQKPPSIDNLTDETYFERYRDFYKDQLAALQKQYQYKSVLETLKAAELQTENAVKLYKALTEEYVVLEKLKLKYGKNTALLKAVEQRITEFENAIKAFRRGTTELGNLLNTWDAVRKLATEQAKLEYALEDYKKALKHKNPGIPESPELQGIQKLIEKKGFEWVEKNGLDKLQEQEIKGETFNQKQFEAVREFLLEYNKYQNTIKNLETLSKAHEAKLAEVKTKIDTFQKQWSGSRNITLGMNRIMPFENIAEFRYHMKLLFPKDGMVRKGVKSAKKVPGIFMGYIIAEEGLHVFDLAYEGHHDEAMLHGSRFAVIYVALLPQTWYALGFNGVGNTLARVNPWFTPLIIYHAIDKMPEFTSTAAKYGNAAIYDYLPVDNNCVAYGISWGCALPFRVIEYAATPALRKGQNGMIRHGLWSLYEDESLYIPDAIWGMNLLVQQRIQHFVHYQKKYIQAALQKLAPLYQEEADLAAVKYGFYTNLLGITCPQLMVPSMVDQDNIRLLKVPCPHLMVPSMVDQNYTRYIVDAQGQVSAQKLKLQNIIALIEKDLLSIERIVLLKQVGDRYQIRFPLKPAISNLEGKLVNDWLEVSGPALNQLQIEHNLQFFAPQQERYEVISRKADDLHDVASLNEYIDSYKCQDRIAFTQNGFAWYQRVLEGTYKALPFKENQEGMHIYAAEHQLHQTVPQLYRQNNLTSYEFIENGLYPQNITNIMSWLEKGNETDRLISYNPEYKTFDLYDKKGNRVNAKHFNRQEVEVEIRNIYQSGGHILGATHAQEYIELYKMPLYEVEVVSYNGMETGAFTQKFGYECDKKTALLATFAEETWQLKTVGNKVLYKGNSFNEVSIFAHNTYGKTHKLWVSEQDINHTKTLALLWQNNRLSTPQYITLKSLAPDISVYVLKSEQGKHKLYNRHGDVMMCETNNIFAIEDYLKYQPTPFVVLTKDTQENINYLKDCLTFKEPLKEIVTPLPHNQGNKVETLLFGNKPSTSNLLFDKGKLNDNNLLPIHSGN